MNFDISLQEAHYLRQLVGQQGHDQVNGLLIRLEAGIRAEQTQQMRAERMRIYDEVRAELAAKDLGGDSATKQAERPPESAAPLPADVPLSGDETH